MATGEAHSVREFAEIAFGMVGLDYEDYIETDPKLYRPAEVDYLLADAEDTFEILNWKPKTSFRQLVEEMVSHDVELARQEKTLIDAGHAISFKGLAGV